MIASHEVAARDLIVDRDRFIDATIERLPIGGVMNGCPEALAALYRLGSSDFGSPDRRAIFDAIRNQDEKGAPLRLASVTSTLAESGWPGAVHELVVCFDEWLPSDRHQLDYLVGRLKLLARARQLQAELVSSWARLVERRDGLEERIEEVVPKLREAIDQALRAAKEGQP